ncbi:hypothetical protein [Shinella sp. DD12]|uniref:hypothetical protein n=1 Tax=Shinella sp. DD12 TaxID=1410620 RepID=UPI000437C3B2|nr:hypothetical protein [Shinella sp. DD12]EYR78210.1 hypothetical protein SHLA_42c000560 [Shinella sp. DD12]
MTDTKSNIAVEPHCVHVIGIGRTGAVYVEALLRTGEVEDNLVNEGTTFSTLLVDVGDGDIQVANDYARSFKTRMASRGIPADRFNHESVVLAPGDASKRLDDVRVSLERFAKGVKSSKHQSTVFIACGLAGKTGSSMVVDVARELAKLDLGSNVLITGVGQLSHSGDGEYCNSAAQTAVLDKIDAVCKSSDNNPFSGGFLVVPTEHSWQRLTAYTSTGVKEVRQQFKQMVTNRFVADSFMRWAVSDGATHLARLTRDHGGKCNMFGIAKFSHPGVQVLPGQARSIWDAALQQWISFVPEYSGLKQAFKTDSIEVHIYAARDMRIDVMEEQLKEVLLSNYMKANSTAYEAHKNEFFDELTSYATIIMPNVGKNDLTSYN